MLNQRWVYGSQVIIAFCLVTVIIIEYISPWAFYWIYQDEYKALSLSCDQAMHNEVAIRQSTVDQPKREALLISSAIELSVCHQYDVLRKKLLIWGVSEDRLALLGLEALEVERVPVSRMVEPHRMSRF